MGLSFVYLYFSALFFVLVHSKHHGLRRRDDSPSPIIGLGSLVAACDRGDPETTYYTAEVGVLFTVVTQNCPGAGLDTVAGSQNINGDYYPISATKRQSDSCTSYAYSFAAGFSHYKYSLHFGSVVHSSNGLIMNHAILRTYRQFSV
ncbi:uncharacterized protein FIBRA_02826 [Fibroporia radiculosa]|uniref:Uncharacterized protein n=1 Tax=Fibroporia radiculosa TaxID=599839 RepID=J4H225_9APHY|nr:uncharacterized protein FIBRA_02826 [Fibroporia radiculosa]CCM00784.1 predicted protein [Fibroporia radiculosa]